MSSIAQKADSGAGGPSGQGKGMKLILKDQNLGKRILLQCSLLGVEEVGYAGKHGDGPTEGGDDGGPSQVGEGEDVEGSADGKVALQGEGDDGEDVGVGGRLREERAQTAKLLSKCVRVLVPED